MTETRSQVGPSLPEVDAAVRAVLADLFAPTRPGSATNGRRPATADDVFAGRLLSLREAERLSEGLRAVRVAPGTVVTPLARDYLKRAGVEVRFVSRSEVETRRNAGTWGFAIESGSGVVEAFRRCLLDGDALWHELGDSLDDAIGWVAEVDGRGALVLTDESALAVYRAYQSPGVRAALACDPDGAARAARSIGVNLLVVEPSGKSIAFLKQIGTTFRRSGGPDAPAWAVEGRPR